MPDEQAQNISAAPAVPAAPARPKCGLVMPISAIGECSASHWSDVKAILTEAITPPDFEANLVSFAKRVPHHPEHDRRKPLPERDGRRRRQLEEPQRDV